MNQKDSILVSVGDNIFAGKLAGMEDCEKRVLLKQSNTSDILLSILIQNIGYIVKLDGEKIEDGSDIYNFIVNSLKG